jgi:transcriptional regulator NrdR family protein
MTSNQGNRSARVVGIQCPKCGCRHFFTTHTEPLRDGRIRRRKRCRHCDRKIITYEATQHSGTAANR